MEKTTTTLQNEVTMEMIGKKRNGHAKPVFCITEGKYFTSVSDAAEYYGIGAGDISKVCDINHPRQTCKGMKFCFAKEMEENLPVIAEEIQSNTKSKGNVDGHSTKQRKVRCIETGIEYESIRQCAREIGMSQTGMYYLLDHNKADVNGNHYEYINSECAECVKELDPILEKANAYDILMGKKALITDLNAELIVLRSKREDIVDKLDALKNDLDLIENDILDKIDILFETEKAVKIEMGLTL